MSRRRPLSRSAKRSVSRRKVIGGATGALMCAGQGAGARAGTPVAATPVAGTEGFFEPGSTCFSTVFVESAATLRTESDGDLWPCAWADDGEMYSLNGDGKGFDLDAEWSDIVMNRISGTPTSGITGQRLAAGDEISPIWGTPSRYNRKPTGMVAVDGDGDGQDELYAAIQDLRHGYGAFDDAPSASIIVSRDYGVTWTPTDEPMFIDHIFTTVFFLDFGQGNRHASVLGPDGGDYVYAYGLDFNWRDSFINTVEDPTHLYLARAPIGSIQARDTWQFFSGLDDGTPAWSQDIGERVAVLSDSRRVYPVMRGSGIRDMTVLSQGSVVYNAPLERYIYTSWTEYTFEFYEAPHPWGPWTLFFRKDFGGYPWFGSDSPAPKNGGYATTIPSKFISDDGREMWLQCNWFVGVGSGSPNYHFSLRRLVVEPYVASKAGNEPDASDNLATADGVTPIEKSTHFGQEEILNDGPTDLADDSFDLEDKAIDFWGYTWPRRYHVNRVVYTTGDMYPDGGWFESDLRVQVRRDFVWHEVEHQTIDPAYPLDDTTGRFTAFTFAFETIDADGIRIIGQPGGTSRFTSISELEVYYQPGEERAGER